MENQRNIALTESFDRYFPVAHSNMRLPLTATDYKTFAVRADGSRIWDADGNEYVDFLGAAGPTILGARNPGFVSALQEFLAEETTVYGSGVLFSPNDIELAEKIVKYVPCAEMVKLSVTGTEAVQTAIRISRAYTGKSIVIRFSDHYHGWADNVLGGVLDASSDDRPHPGESLDDPTFTLGKSPWAVNETFLLPWNDADALTETFEKYHDEIAMVHFEGIVCNHFNFYPKPGYLELIRELCDRFGVVMSMDEVITGFRTGLGGAQALLGVTPDICTLGKSISNGLPISAVAGKREIMSVLRDKKVLGPGTYNGFALGVRAACATIDELAKDDENGYAVMAQRQERLISEVLASAARHDIPLSVSEMPGAFYLIFGIDKGRGPFYTNDDLNGMDEDLLHAFWKAMLKEGFVSMWAGKWYMSFAHTDADIDLALAAVDRVFARIGVPAA